VLDTLLEKPVKPEIKRCNEIASLTPKTIDMKNRLLFLFAFLIIFEQGFSFAQDPVNAPQTLTEIVVDAKTVLMGCRAFAADYDGAFPSLLSELFPDYLSDAKWLIYENPNDEKSIRWIYTKGLADTDPGKTVVLKSKKLMNGKQVVAYMDGSVRSE
tara:strand:+ start:2486 stop:2956 length:471 start_codon:yes stop_codon:yes gene_type:complete